MVLVTVWGFRSGRKKPEEVERMLPRFNYLGPPIDRLALLCSLRRLLRSTMRYVVIVTFHSRRVFPSLAGCFASSAELFGLRVRL